MSQRDQVLRFMKSAEQLAPDGFTMANIVEATSIPYTSLRVVLTAMVREKLIERPKRGHYVLSDLGRSDAGMGRLSPFDFMVLEYAVCYPRCLLSDKFCREQQTTPNAVGPAIKRLEARGLIATVGSGVWYATPEGIELWEERTAAMTPDWEKAYNKAVDDWHAFEASLKVNLNDEFDLDPLVEIDEETQARYMARYHELLPPYPRYEDYEPKDGEGKEVGK